MGKSKHRLEFNSRLEEKIEEILDFDGHINGQRRFPVNGMRFGVVSAGMASCEIIAVFNVLRDIGIKVKLSELIYEAEKSGFLSLMGLFGTKIRKIGRILDNYKIEYIKLSGKKFLRMVQDGVFCDGQIFIASIWTRSDFPISALHTFEMVKRGDHWTVYNRFDLENVPVLYKTAGDVLRNGRHTGSYYKVYMIRNQAVTD